jgi:transposase
MMGMMGSMMVMGSMADRPVRDLLRRRLLFVGQRTQQILSFQSMVARNLAKQISVNEVKKLKEEDVEEMFEHPQLVVMGICGIATIRHLTKVIRSIEKEAIGIVKLRPEFGGLKTIPGIGDILALTIMLEVGDIDRFLKVGNYSSYCRCVQSVRTSNSKSKGKGNAKNGNKYLSWAYVEAANFAIRFSPEAQRFYQRKMAKINKIVAIKALSNKLARASYYIMRDQVPFDAKKLFG